MTQFRTQLEQLPVSDRSRALKIFVEAQFGEALMLEANEQVDFGQSFFDLGLTSLKVTQVRQLLEEQLDCNIDTTQMFSYPTVPALLNLLEQDLLACINEHGTVIDPMLAQLAQAQAEQAQAEQSQVTATFDSLDINALISKQFNM